MTREALLKEIEKEFGTGCAVICRERARQVEVERFTPLNDWNRYRHQQLATAAACYARPDFNRNIGPSGVPLMWPFNDKWWKPTPDNRSRELEKAGALVAGQIDILFNTQ